MLEVEAQPLRSQVRRVAEALDFVGSPLSPEERAALERACETEGTAGVRAIQDVLAPHVLFAVHVNPESRVKVRPGPAPRSRDPAPP